jgi:uncharacterized protein YbjT (DUF2867 family)
MKNTKILVLGATGMLGHTLLTKLSKNGAFKVHGTARKAPSLFLMGNTFILGDCSHLSF